MWKKQIRFVFYEAKLIIYYQYVVIASNEADGIWHKNWYL